MSTFSRGVRATIRPSRQLLSRQSRRFDSHQAGHGSSESAFHVDSGATGTESMGKGFYITLALIPTFAISYLYSDTSGNSFVNKMADSYWYGDRELNRINDTYRAALEQASIDRALFQSEKQDRSGVDLRFPEAFNFGSPWNVVAGQGGADLGKLVAHYEEKEKQKEEDRVKRMVDGKVVTVYDNNSGSVLPKVFPYISEQDIKER